MRRSGHAAAAGRPMKPPARHDETARGESITAGIFVDGVPESIALGLTIAEDELGVALLVGIVLGNVVEAYGAAQPILAGSHRPGFALRLLGGDRPGSRGGDGGRRHGPREGERRAVGTAEAVAAGAVLAVVSIAIVPYAFAEVSSRVATATVLGFVAGYLLS